MYYTSYCEARTARTERDVLDVLRGTYCVCRAYSRMYCGGHTGGYVVRVLYVLQNVAEKVACRQRYASSSLVP